MNEDVTYHLVNKIKELRSEVQKIIDLYKKVEEMQFEELWDDEQIERIKIESARLREEIKKVAGGR